MKIAAVCVAQYPDSGLIRRSVNDDVWKNGPTAIAGLMI